jgi:2-dehydro-3-deoxyphosphogalactonate aldolase
MDDLTSALREVPLMAILRGLQPASAADIGQAILDAGWKAVEVPLNRPGAFACIEILASGVPDLVVGAGTVVDPASVARVRDAGGTFVVSPHLDEEVVAAAIRLGMTCAPGVCTPTESYRAHRLGCALVKVFPMQAIGVAGLRAMAEVAPEGQAIVAVGGISDANAADVLAAGAFGLGIASWLFRPGDAAHAVGERADLMRSVIENKEETHA